MWLEKIILKKAERGLAPYRNQAEVVRKNLSVDYERCLPQIDLLYKQATHWHGTGRYHYQHEKESRYQNICTDVTTDILISILESNGLRPHTDPWIDSGGETVSLATTRMHARAFARIHAVSAESLLYELGSIKYWLRFYFVLLFVWLFSNLRTHISFIKSLFRKTFSSDIQNWASAIRKPSKNKVVSIFDIFKGDIPTSDIGGNYPVLIGIAADSKNLVETIPLTNKVEQRSLQPITLNVFTHLEVPFQKVSETEDLLKKYNSLLPVIPMEFGDIYLASEPLDKLAFS